MALKWACGCRCWLQGKRLQWESCGEFHPDLSMVDAAEEIAFGRGPPPALFAEECAAAWRRRWEQARYRRQRATTP